MTLPIKSTVATVSFEQNLLEVKDQVTALSNEVATMSIFRLTDRQTEMINLFGKISASVLTLVMAGLACNKSFMISLFRTTLRL